MTKKLLYSVFLLFILIDSGYSFLQHYHMPLDGDMAESIVPSKQCKPVFESPFGAKALIGKEHYLNPNRFFSHWIYQQYFKNAPLLLQNVTDPINSVYISAAIFKTVVQLGFIFVLAVLISGTYNVLKMKFILTAFLITPLIQVNGYRSYMGIIDPSITYSFFYAFPVLLMLIYFLPFIRQLYHNVEPRLANVVKLLWIPLAIVISLSGPINPGVILIFSAIVFVSKAIHIYRSEKDKNFINRCLSSLQKIPKYYWFYLLPISLLSLYSLYLGQFNSNNAVYPESLFDKYSKILTGLYKIFTQKPGLPVLFIILIVNLILLNKKENLPEKREIFNAFIWIGLFVLVYISLLPLGGYREYRPYFVRYDTLIPVTLCLIFLFGISSLFLVNNLKGKFRIGYIIMLLAVMFIYTNADKAEFNKNNCEKTALQNISKSKKEVIHLQQDCTVISWYTIKKPENSAQNARLLQIWHITDKKKLYYH